MHAEDHEQEKRAAMNERVHAEERLAEVLRLSPLIAARARRLEAMKRQNGFAEKIHRALVGGTA